MATEKTDAVIVGVGGIAAVPSSSRTSASISAVPE